MNESPNEPRWMSTSCGIDALSYLSSLEFAKDRLPQATVSTLSRSLSGNRGEAGGETETWLSAELCTRETHLHGSYIPRDNIIHHWRIWKGMKETKRGAGEQRDQTSMILPSNDCSRLTLVRETWIVYLKLEIECRSSDFKVFQSNSVQLVPLFVFQNAIMNLNLLHYPQNVEWIQTVSEVHFIHIQLCVGFCGPWRHELNTRECFVKHSGLC